MRAVSRVMLPGHPGPGTVCRSHRSDAQKPNSRDFSNTQSQYNLPKLVPFSIISHQVARPRSKSIGPMGMMTVFWEPNCWAISCWPRFPASLTWATARSNPFSYYLTEAGDSLPRVSSAIFNRSLETWAPPIIIVHSVDVFERQHSLAIHSETYDPSVVQFRCVIGTLKADQVIHRNAIFFPIRHVSWDFLWCPNPPCWWWTGERRLLCWSLSALLKLSYMRNPCKPSMFRVCETACKFWLLRHKRSLEGPWFLCIPTTVVWRVTA